MKKVLAMILAGGKGERLYPLTRDRAKPAVPFGGTYRIIDFTLSNCVNSCLRKIYVLTQYKSLSLDRHIQKSWGFLNNRVGEYVYLTHAQQRINKNWYKGTADAIYQNFYTIQEEKPDLVLILSGDHIYRMDYRELIDSHLKNNADLTVSTMEFDKNYSKEFGVIETDNKNKITGFQEKPARPKTIEGKPDSILVNMGIYLFNTDILVKRLIENAKKSDTNHDFGKNVIPAMLKTDNIFSHSFNGSTKNRLSYWRDVGTLDAYYEANMDLLKGKQSYSLFDSKWPNYTAEEQAPPARITGSKSRDNRQYGTIINSIISRGCDLNNSSVKDSILSPHVIAGEYSTIESSILLDNIKIGKECSIKNAIIDKGAVIPDGTLIGYDSKKDARLYTISDSGIVVIPKNTAFKI
jgi:glucose-1-phosphate adenylyltransferase